VDLFHFVEWLGTTSWSIALHESRYVFLVVLMVHVLTVSVFVGTAVMIDLRLLGRTLTHVPASRSSRASCRGAKPGSSSWS